MESKTRMNRRILLVACFALSPALVAERVPGRYIVELSTEPVAEHMARRPGRAGMLDSPEAVSHRTRLRGEQQRMHGRLAQRRAQVLDSTENVANAIIVQMPDEEAARLAAEPGVLRVHPVRTIHMVLDRAVLLHKVA